MEHLLQQYMYLADANLRGFVFGFVHIFIMLIGYYSGWSINRFLKIASNGYIAGVFGAALAHIFADLIASYLDPHVRSMIVGIVIGGIIPLLFVPFLGPPKKLLNYQYYLPHFFLLKVSKSR